MTFREKLAIEHPDAVSEDYIGGCGLCPISYGYEDEKPYACRDGSLSCANCWNREMQNNSNTCAKCNGNGNIFKNPMTNEWYLSVQTSVWDRNADDWAYEKVYISYCPFCGRKL